MKFIVEPWTHQREALAKAMQCKNFAFFMEMGTGKTKVTIETLRMRYAQENRVMRTLILCPPVMVETWRREIGVHSKCAAHVLPLVGTGKAREIKLAGVVKNKEPKILVTNYESLSMKEVYSKLLEYKPEILVCDESQRLKNYKSIRTRLTITLADAARHRYLLSGTPILNNPMDIFAQYRVLDGGDTFGTNFFSFRARYFVDKNAGMPTQKYFPNWQPLPGIAEVFSEAIYKKAVRYLKKDCLDLPPLIKKRVVVELNREQRRMYDEMGRDFITYLGTEACVASIALTKGLRLQQIVSGFYKTDEGKEVSYGAHPRLEALSDLLETITTGAKVIVWAMFQENYNAIGNVCRELGLTPAFLYGGMTDKSRTENIDKFQTDPTCRVMIANQQAGGVGVTLTAASYSIFFSRSFSLEADLQAEARNHRGGSEVHDKVTRIDLVAQDTIDEIILDALERKENLANNILRLRDVFGLGKPSESSTAKYSLR